MGAITNESKDTTHHMRDGEVVIAKRPNTQKWQMRIKMPDGSWKHQSTKTADLDLAKKVATEIYDDIRWSVKKGLPLDTERKFNDAAEIYAKQLRNGIEAETNKPVDVTYLGITNGYIIPFFRGVPLSSVDDEKYEAYKNWLPAQMGKKEIAKSTYNAHNVVLRAIFDIARRKKWINSGEIPKITVKGIGRKAKRRPAFEAQEWNRLTAFMRSKKWLEGSEYPYSNYKRKVLRIMVLVLANTGMRPGGEPLNLKWKHVSFFFKKDKFVPGQSNSGMAIEIQQANLSDVGETASSTKYVKFNVTGKTSKFDTEGWRPVIGRHNVEGWLDELKEITGRTDDEDYLFCLQDGAQIKGMDTLFKQMMVEANLLRDSSGAARTLYSLRHTYATLRVRNYVPYNVLARQMGTSVEMISRHYDHTLVEHHAELLAS